MSAKKKGIEHFEESKNDELICLAVLGSVVGGIRHEYGEYKGFEPIGIALGAATFTLAGLAAAAPEALAGLFIYNIEGALLATIASASYEAAFLTLISLPSYSYPVMLTSATVGSFIYGARRAITNNLNNKWDAFENLTNLVVDKYNKFDLFGKSIDNQLEMS